MNTCDFCGGPRINGVPLNPSADRWEPARRKSMHTRFACRSCAKERLQ